MKRRGKATNQNAHSSAVGASWRVLALFKHRCQFGLKMAHIAPNAPTREGAEEGLLDALRGAFPLFGVGHLVDRPSAKPIARNIPASPSPPVGVGDGASINDEDQVGDAPHQLEEGALPREDLHGRRQ